MAAMGASEIPLREPLISLIYSEAINSHHLSTI